MLYHLLTMLSDEVGFFRVARYASFRIPAAALTALVLMLWLFPNFIEYLRRLQRGVSNVREDTPEQHQEKKGTPTMGGLFILVSVSAGTLLWADLTNTYVWVVLWVLLGFGAIGFVDDYTKVAKKNSKGLAGKRKLLAQTVVLALGVGIIALSQTEMSFLVPIDVATTIAFPFFKGVNPDLGWAFVLFAFFVIVGTSNAVNLTDGLDGLAIGPTIVSAFTFMVLAYAGGLVLTISTQGSVVVFNVADYLNIPHVDGIGELAIVCAAIAGAGIGFLWFNTFPASIFMGDVGSLALGGALGVIAVLTKNELLSAIVHGVFLMEALSVISQVASYKTTGKRIFRMAPIHHHFELKGWPEPKIIVRFWIVSIMLAIFALVTLKLR